MGKPPLPEDCPASLLASLSRPRNQQTQPRPFAILPRQGFSWQDGSCATQLHPARGKSLWTPSCSALRFSHKKTREKSCQCFRQWIQKKGGECSNTPRPAGQFPRQNHRSETIKVFAPEEWRAPQGLLVCLVAEEATQDNSRRTEARKPLPLGEHVNHQMEML